MTHKAVPNIAKYGNRRPNPEDRRSRSRAVLYTEIFEKL